MGCCCYRDWLLNSQNIGGWGLTANRRPGSEAGSQSEASIECSLAVLASSQYFIAETSECPDHNSRSWRAGREALAFKIENKNNFEPRYQKGFSIFLCGYFSVHNNVDIIDSFDSFCQKPTISTIHISGKYFLWKILCPSETDSYWDLSDSI